MRERHRIFPESKPNSKGCETAVLEMVTELRNDVGKVKKIICEQNGNIDKEIERETHYVHFL